MKKYNVRVYFHTFVDVEVEAESEEEAIEIAESTDFDCTDQILENLVIADDTDAAEAEPTIYEMKLALEQDGWDWNVLDMMDEDEIKCKYDEINNN